MIKTFLVLFEIALFSIVGSSPTQTANCEANIDVTINKVDYSIFENDNQLIGEFFYEKPYINEKYPASEKINDYFEQDCNNFFDGTAEFYGENAFQRMREDLKEGIEHWGSAVSEQPYCYYVDTEMTFLSEKYVSFRQSYVWAAGGPSDVWNKGVTFDLNTGESVPFTSLMSIDINEFRDDLSKVMLGLSSFKDIQAVQAEIGELDEKVLDTKNYFFDGEYINVPLNQFCYPSHNGLIFKWNSNREGSIYSYFLKRKRNGSNISQGIYD